MVAIAGSRPRGSTVDLTIRDSDTLVGVVAKNNMLSADQRGSDMINPDQISVIQRNSITAPDVLRVKIGDVNILDNNILRTPSNVKTLALDDTLTINTNKRLIRLDNNRIKSSLVVLNGRLGSVGLIIIAPVVLVDGKLARGGSSPRRTTSLGCSAF